MPNWNTDIHCENCGEPNPTMEIEPEDNCEYTDCCMGYTCECDQPENH